MYLSLPINIRISELNIKILQSFIKQGARGFQGPLRFPEAPGNVSPSGRESSHHSPENNTCVPLNGKKNTYLKEKFDCIQGRGGSKKNLKGNYFFFRFAQNNYNF